MLAQVAGKKLLLQNRVGLKLFWGVLAPSEAVYVPGTLLEKSILGHSGAESGTGRGRGGRALHVPSLVTVWERRQAGPREKKQVLFSGK